MSRETKRSNFKPVEDLALSTCWVSVSQRATEQNSETFWNRVAADYNKQPSITHRSSASLKCRWTAIQRVTQKFLATDKLYRANTPSGETEEDTKAHVMELYRQRNGTLEKGGTKKLAAPVKFIEAVMLLSIHPKFSTSIAFSLAPDSWLRYSPRSLGSSEVSSASRLQTSSNEDRDASPCVPSSNSNISMAAPSRSRPRGVKLEKAENAVEAGAEKMAKSIDRVGRAIENSTKGKLLASSVAIQFKIIKSLPLNEEEKGAKLMVLLSQASSMVESEQPDRAGTAKDVREDTDGDVN